MIAADGPMTVARYMALCLGHPKHGYYVTRDPFGVAGDFTTAPEISQIFGELLGLWAAAVWQSMGRPRPCTLAELGPGRGTLMADALRGAAVVPGFREALAVHLVETSPLLRARQQATLSAAGIAPQWHETVETLPAGPVIVLANEFFDALPVHQAVKTEQGWHERMLGLNADGQLAFALNPSPFPSELARSLPRTRESISHLSSGSPLARGRAAESCQAGDASGTIFEWRDDTILRQLCQTVVKDGGAILIIDYGHMHSGIGETLQAVRAHSFVDPLQAPGECDLTAHVDFAALSRSAASVGARVHGPIAQGEFLRDLGINLRAGRLKVGATGEQVHAIDAAVTRLTGAAPNQMGELFKVIGFSHSDLHTLPGFEAAAAMSIT
jgi:SAM-dependent MidA family methyltransferase